MKKRNIKFKNIQIELFKTNNSINDLADMMGITKQSLYMKLNGSSNILYKDIKAIQQILQELNNTKYTLDYLFEEYDN